MIGLITIIPSLASKTSQIVIAPLSTAIAGQYDNVGKATGKTPSSGSVNASYPSHYYGSVPQINLSKDANGTNFNVGDEITYTLIIRNMGTTNLLITNLTDTRISAFDKDPVGTVLAPIGTPGDSITVYGKYIVLDSDLPGPLVNVAVVEGEDSHGNKVNDTDDSTVNLSSLVVSKSADPRKGVKGAPINYTVTATNIGSTALTISGVDVLDPGLRYVSDEFNGTENPMNTITWTNIFRLDPGASRSFQLYAYIDGSVNGTLWNEVTFTGRTDDGKKVSGTAKIDIVTQIASINITKEAYPLSGVPGTKINYTVVVTNTGEADLCQVSVMDILPDGLKYLSDDHHGIFTEPNQVTWPNLGCLTSGESLTILMDTEIVGTVIGNLDNNINVSAIPRGGGQPVTGSAKARVNADPVPYIITKTSDKSSYQPGEEMTYTIKVCNIMEYQTLEEVVVKDVFQDSKVQIIASYPESVDGQWYFSSIAPKDCVTITLVAVYPASNMTFEVAGSDVSGSGFVNVHNDLSTGVAPFPVTNCVYVTAKIYDTDRQDYTSWSREKCYAVTIADIGTELQIREHGSGDYESEEITKLTMRNKSIESSKTVSADYHPTNFELPSGNGINYNSKWTEESRGINHITGSTMHEAYRYATDVDRDTYIKLDENGSIMKINSSFEGQGTIGFFKKASFDSGPKVKPAFEDEQRYSGRFQLNQSFEEYGSNAQSIISSTGEGFASADRRIRDSQRSYEYGTGTYKSEQILDTFTNYIAKDIELTNKPSGFNYTPSLKANQNIKWSEGMWSKTGKLVGGDILSANSSCAPVKKQNDEPCVLNGTNTPPATYISEEYSSLQYLKKESVALGLNEMKTNVTFSGMADYKAKTSGVNNRDKVDSEELYVGDYDITRHVLATGVSKYSIPHLTVSKVGHLKNEWVNRVNGTVADYLITITNDGSKSLAPLYVTDRFPAGTEYVSSSYKPASISTTSANWTILHLGIGSSLTISLKLNVTDEASGSLVNRVSVSGIASDSIVTASNISIIASDMMPCCLSSKVVLDKTGDVNSLDPTLVNFTIFVKNTGDRTMAVKLTDELPSGMMLLTASRPPDSSEYAYINWVLPDLKPDEEVNITYSVRAASNGAYTNKVHMEASAVDGSGEETADASATVDVRGTGVAPKTLRYDGWQPPDWDFNTSDQDLTL